MKNTSRIVNTRQARDLVRIAFGPSLTALLIIAAIVLLQLVIANSDMTGALGAIASSWLAVHLVPVSIAGQQLAVLPLLPAMTMMWATARTTAQATAAHEPWWVVRWIVASAFGGPLLIAAIMLAIIHDAASVLVELQTPHALHAFFMVFVIHGGGAVLGVGSRVGRRVRTMLQLPAWLEDSVRPAVTGVLALLGLCGAITAVSLVVHWGVMDELYGITDSFFGHLSLTVLSLLYVPNVLIGAAAVAVGSSAHIGFATFNAFTVFGGDIPALPILAVAPSPPLNPVWVALLIVGAVAGVALGQQCARRPLPWRTAVSKLAFASGLAAVMMVILGEAAGGWLGNFGAVGVDQTTFGPAVFLWFFIIGGATVILADGVSRQPAHLIRYDAAREDTGDDQENDPGSVLAESLPEQEPQHVLEPAAEVHTEPEPEPHPVSELPPPTTPNWAIRPALGVDDIEDLMIVDDDIDPSPSGQ